MKNRFPFRLGTTSFILRDDILPNVHFLKDKVDHIELLVFETDEQSNYPSAETVAELNAVAADHDLTYTVHLPIGIKLGSPDGTRRKKDIETVLEEDKVLSRSQGHLRSGNVSIDGYEIHMGKTTLGPEGAPLVQLTSRNGAEINETDGARSADGKVWGSYFHGLFDFPEFRNHYLKSLDTAYSAEDIEAAADFKERQYDLLAEHFAQHLDMDKLCEIVGVAR